MPTPRSPVRKATLPVPATAAASRSSSHAISVSRPTNTSRVARDPPTPTVPPPAGQRPPAAPNRNARPVSWPGLPARRRARRGAPASRRRAAARRRASPRGRRRCSRPRKADVRPGPRRGRHPARRGPPAGRWRARGSVRRHVTGRPQDDPGQRELRRRADGEAASSGTSRARPKSTSFTPGVRKMFEGLTSRWTMPASCNAVSAASRSSARSRVSAERERSPAQTAGEGLTGQELHGQERQPVMFAHLEDRAQIRMADLGRGASLAEEALPGRLVRSLEGLERHLAPEALVLGSEDDAHAPFPQELEDAVAADPVGQVFGRNGTRLPVEQPSKEADDAQVSPTVGEVGRSSQGCALAGMRWAPRACARGGSSLRRVLPKKTT